MRAMHVCCVRVCMCKGNVHVCPPLPCPQVSRHIKFGETLDLQPYLSSSQAKGGASNSSSSGYYLTGVSGTGGTPRLV